MSLFSIVNEQVNRGCKVDECLKHSYYTRIGLSFSRFSLY